MGIAAARRGRTGEGVGGPRARGLMPHSSNSGEVARDAPLPTLAFSQPSVRGSPSAGWAASAPAGALQLVGHETEDRVAGGGWGGSGRCVATSRRGLIPAAHGRRVAATRGCTSLGLPAHEAEGRAWRPHAGRRSRRAAHHPVGSHRRLPHASTWHARLLHASGHASGHPRLLHHAGLLHATTHAGHAALHPRVLHATTHTGHAAVHPGLLHATLVGWLHAHAHAHAHASCVVGSAHGLLLRVPHRVPHRTLVGLLHAHAHASLHRHHWPSSSGA
mmetsp:Transcript_95076/g.245626  ORF Transcript_95076/g.245626 Transcript_95076/m.245626 type:complete len:275 (+) Transcript_95076:322-1146(+)